MIATTNTPSTLEGIWQYRLDDAAPNATHGWLDGFAIPGTAATNNVGESLDPQLSQRFDNDSLRAFRERTSVVGTLWLRNTVSIPADWQGHDLHIMLGRALGVSALWVSSDSGDPQVIGQVTSLSTPHEYIVPGIYTNTDRLTLIVRLDNRDHWHLDDKASAYSVDTQGYWIGLIGDARIEPGSLKDADVDAVFDDDGLFHVIVPDMEHRRITLRLVDDEGQAVCIEPRSDGVYALREPVRTWDEWSPAYYDAAIDVDGQQFTKRVGLTRIGTQGKRIVMNGRKVFLRGNLDSGIAPDTGHFPTSEAEWRRILTVQQEYGFNHVRFHSWCPPEAAFRVADELGMILAPEGPFWMDDWFHDSVGDYPEHYDIIASELARIAATYGHHPSFALFAAGNELAGDFDFISRQLAEPTWKRHHILTTTSSNTTNLKRDFYPSTDDYYVGVEHHGKGLRGNRFLDRMVETTTLNYNEGAAEVPRPIIGHELGQYAGYPDLGEIGKFSADGPMAPTNLEAIGHELDRLGVRSHAAEWTRRSVAFASELYKAELSAAARSEFTGYQILELQDYPGQLTAMVGLLDSHWQPKPGAVGASKFRRFNDQITPFVELQQRILDSAKPITYTVRVRNSSDHDLSDAQLSVTLHAPDGYAVTNQERIRLAQGTCAVVAHGEFSPTGTAHFQESLGGQFTITTDLEEQDGTTWSNEETIWAFQNASDQPAHSNVVVDTTLSATVRDALEQGDSCIVTLDPARHRFVRPGNWLPVFWSPAFFETTDSSGAMIQSTHRLFKRFPAKDDFASLLFKALFENGVCWPCHHDNTVMANIPNFTDNVESTFLEEFRVGPGRLIVTGFDLEHASGLEEIAFRTALLDYASSHDCRPTHDCDFDGLLAMFPDSGEPSRISYGEDLALRRPVRADNEKSRRMGSAKAVDGNPLTAWTAAAQTAGHWLSIDLDEPKHISHVVVEPINPESVNFDLEASDDGETWHMLRTADSVGFTAEHDLTVDTNARYLRLTMHHPLNTAPGLKRVSMYA